ncbi:uncharacterized protein LOC121879558 [Homarus americanus]|uniref:uncharacterized protein LOC121879558 n=1 Tax=Homarus americanus TaxID=6706 RepID=UPI001C48FB7B|nr:uncharacterized protein LOC121879558 [Homarus americanus]
MAVVATETGGPSIPQAPRQKPHTYPVTTHAVATFSPRHCFALTTGRLLWWASLLLLWFCCLHHVHSQKCIKLAERNLILPPPRYVYDKREQRQLAITLDTSQRISHQLTTAVVKILLEVSVVATPQLLC